MNTKTTEKEHYNENEGLDLGFNKSFGK